MIDRYTPDTRDRKPMLAAADILRGRMDASEYKDFIFGLLFLKRCSDLFAEQQAALKHEALAHGDTEAEADEVAEDRGSYGGLFVPPIARWDYLRDHVHVNVGDGLSKALHALQDDNPSLAGIADTIRFVGRVGNREIPDAQWRRLITHFSKYRLGNADFEHADLLGAAYEYLVYEFAESAGKKGGEFYTPRSVVRMMVRLVDPGPGMRVYAPCCGSGGMLIYAKLHVEEHGGDASDLSLYGQDNNGSAWAICKMNLFLHGISAKAFIENDDTLKNPAFTDPGGGILRFDRVLSNPPFSMNYEREGMAYEERFAYG